MLAGLEMNTETGVLVGAAFAAVWGLLYFLLKEKTKEIERNERLLLSVAEKLEEAADAKRGKEHRKKFERIAPVLPDRNSPPTAAQEKAADNQTIKARIVAAVKDLGLEPIEDPAMPKVVAHDEVEITGTAKVTEAGSVKVKAEGSKSKP